MSLGSKVYFRIGEVASLVGVEPHVLRYWEREFRSIRPTKSAKGQRVYSRKDVETLLRVKELLYGQGFTIAGARRKLRDRNDDGLQVVADGDDATMPAFAAAPAPMPLAVTHHAPQVLEVPQPRAAFGIRAQEPHDESALLREHLVTIRSEVTALLRDLSSRK